MKRSSLRGAFVALLAISGCTVTRSIPRPRTAEQFQALVEQQGTSITLLPAQPGQVRTSVSLPLAPEAIPAAGPGGPSLDLSKLRGYETKRHGAGALEGLGFGILGGFVAGALVGSAAGSDGPCQNDDGGCVMFSSGEKALALGFIGAIPGAVIGAIIGASMGQTDRYLFTDEPPRP